VNEVVGVAGFVMPGTHVDVIVTVSNDGSGAQAGAMARTVVSNVLVLTAGTRYDRQDPKNTQPQPSSVVTLAVIPEDGERIALASQQGAISLALRNPVDVDPTKTAGIRLAALMRAPGDQPVVDPKENRVIRPRVIQQVVAPPPPVVPAVYRVETIRAASGLRRSFTDHECVSCDSLSASPCSLPSSVSLWSRCRQRKRRRRRLYRHLHRFPNCS
jgi:pilus assembly protein CpaB